MLPRCDQGHDFSVNAIVGAEKLIPTMTGAVTVVPIHCLQCGYVFGLLRK